MLHRLLTAVWLIHVLSVHSLSAADLTPKVLLIGIDGCRPDALKSAKTPNIDVIAQAGIKGI